MRGIPCRGWFHSRADSRTTSRLGRLFLVVAGLFSGCVISLGPATWIEEVRNFEVESGGLLGVDLKTHNGSIEVEADRVPGEPLEITATVRGGGSDADDARACLEAIDLEVFEQAGVILARWKWREGHDPRWRARVDLRVHQLAELSTRAQSHNGGVSIRGVVADCDATTHNGSIVFDECIGGWRAVTHNGSITAAGTPGVVFLQTHNGRIAASLGHGSVSGDIETHNGSVRLTLDDGSAARLVCRTHNGGISVHRPFERVEKTRRSFEGQLGSAAQPLHVTTHNGGISLR